MEQDLQPRTTELRGFEENMVELVEADVSRFPTFAVSEETTSIRKMEKSNNAIENNLEDHTKGNRGVFV